MMLVESPSGTRGTSLWPYARSQPADALVLRRPSRGRHGITSPAGTAAQVYTLNAGWLQPEGTRADFDQFRWQGPKAEEFGKLTDEIGTLPLGDPKIQELFNQAMTIYMEELPVIPITQAKKIIPFDTTYWTGWPTFDNQYIHPPTWWQQFPVILQNLTATGAQ